MIKLFTIVFLFTICFSSALCQPIIYISPGIGISWNFDGKFILTPKISLGVYNESIFYNLTFAYASASEETVYPHYLIEFQCGRLSPPMEYRKLQLFWGGGVGVTIPTTSKDSAASFRATVFTGNLLFLNLSILFTKRIQTEIGGQIVLPIPLSKIDFGSPGG
jgi:hypothetical protein